MLRVWAAVWAAAAVTVGAASLTPSPPSEEGEDGWEWRHHNNSEVEAALREVAGRCGQVARLYALSETSVRDVPLWVIELSDHPGQHELLEPEFKYVANMHGNEVVGRELLLALAHYLCDRWRAGDEHVRQLLSTTRVHLLPSMNPDGWQLATDTGGRSYLTGRTNNRSVDLNRDFPDLDRVMYGNEAHHLDRNHHLMSQLRRLQHQPQPETLAVMRWVLDTPFVLSANFHGGDLVANYPYDASRSGARRQYAASPDDHTFKHLARVYAAHHPTMGDPHRPPCPHDHHSFGPEGGVTNGAHWYSVAGGMQDFNYLSSNALEVTLEVGCDKYPPARALHDYWHDNRDAMLHYLWQVHTGVKGVVRDSISGRGVAGAVIHVKNVTRLNDTHRTDEDILHDVTSVHGGDYWRLLTPGQYEVRASAEGYLPLTHTVALTNPPFTEALRRDFDLAPAPPSLPSPPPPPPPRPSPHKKQVLESTSGGGEVGEGWRANHYLYHDQDHDQDTLPPLPALPPYQESLLTRLRDLARYRY